MWSRSRRKTLQSTENASGSFCSGKWPWSEHRSHNRHILLDLCSRNVLLDLLGGDLIRHSPPAKKSKSEASSSLMSGLYARYSAIIDRWHQMHQLDRDHQQYAQRYFNGFQQDRDRAFTDYQVMLWAFLFGRSCCNDGATVWTGLSEMRERMASLGRDTEMELEGGGTAQVGREAVERTTSATSRQYPFQAPNGTRTARRCIPSHIIATPLDLSLSFRLQRAQEERREERRWRRYGRSEHYHHHGVKDFAWQFNGGGNRDAFGYYAILSLDPTSA